MNSARKRAAILASSLLLAVTLPATETLAAIRTSAPGPGSTSGAVAKVQGEVVATRNSRLDAALQARTINYYPSNAGWSAMWTSFDAARIDADLAQAAALGADNVRVIVFPQSFGFPTPKAEYAERLRKFISIADAHGLTVKLTLFDWWAGYRDAAGSAAWVKALLTPYANDPRVLAVELKNEFQPADTAAVTWVRNLIPVVRAAVPEIPLTLSTDGQTGAAGLARIKSLLAATPLDYYDFHFYGNSERALAEIRKAQAAVAPAPIVIGETGLSTTSHSEGDQAAYLARVFRAAAVAGVDSVAPWTLYDFRDGAIPSNSAVSKLPAQYRFGLLRADGSAKRAADVVRSAWTTGALAEDDILNLDFEASPENSPWQSNLPQLGTAVLVDDVAHSGSTAARFSRTTRTSSGLPALRTSPISPVQAGQRWHAAAWARGSNATGITEIALSWFDINDKWLGQATSARLKTGTTGWTKLTVDAVAPAGATSVQLHLKSGDNTGTVWFDDVTLSS
ncbi:cellulase family glycosylhydrolase [Actinoplanes sp. NBC_00393]|uniref:cellulase family glycosylhydrolase n=1 Tax=Actinoplanes sp. NBC_00393 TaxID=2975953 RepID=UPI002E242EC5